MKKNLIVLSAFLFLSTVIFIFSCNKNNKVSTLPAVTLSPNNVFEKPLLATSAESVTLMR